jgi:alkylation response protein AidB-like acyl-CoA dehydrogenase
MTADGELERTMRQLLHAGAFWLPTPGTGDTAYRHAALARIAAEDLQLARLAEAHVDAIAILDEANRVPKSDALYGVWAAEDPGSKLTVRCENECLVIDGIKPFCTGAGLLDSALVSARDDKGNVILIDVSLDNPQITFDHSKWLSPAFSSTRTASASFDAVVVQAHEVVGSAGWYLNRVGFWHGACGPAACWAGGAIGLIDYAVAVARHRPAEPHRDAPIGALLALRWELVALLKHAGEQIDSEPADKPAAHQRAIMLRHLVERVATQTVDLVGQLLGPRSLAFDEFVVRRIPELQLYVRQHHDQRDLASIARLA